MSELPTLTYAEAAELFGVSVRTVAAARSALKWGTAALPSALETGRISVNGAEWLANNAAAPVQDWVVARPEPAEMRRRLRTARLDPELAERLAGRRNPRDEIPRPILVPVIRTVAISAARAASRATIAHGGKRPKGDHPAPAE
jgi:hypothetical protein